MKRMIAPIGSLGLALLIGVGAMVAHAMQPENAKQDPVFGAKLGSIDMEEVYNASGAPTELEQAGRQHEAEGSQRINKIMAVPYLEAAELQDYGALIGKAQVTPEDEKKAAALKTVNDGRAAELGVLEGKPKDGLNAQDLARIAHLEELKRTLQNQVRPGLVADFRTQQEGWLQEYRHRQFMLLRQEVAKVAKEKGIAHVFEASTLVYSINDLTPAMLQRISKRAPKR